MKKKSKDDILKIFDLFDSGTEYPGAIDKWLTADAPDVVFEKLQIIDENPITYAQFNELLTRAKISSISEDFFSFYWLKTPKHPYDTRTLPKFETDYEICNANKGSKKNQKVVSVKKKEIVSLDHLYWGIYRIFVDALLYYGNINRAFHDLKNKNENYIKSKFEEFIFDPSKMSLRGISLDLEEIKPEARHLISEAACKNLDAGGREEFLQDLMKSYQLVVNDLLEEKKPIEEITVKEVTANLSRIRENKVIKDEIVGDRSELEESAKQKSILDFNTTLGSIYDEKIDDTSKLTSLFNKVISEWEKARPKALSNTHNYLSKIRELDVYVATSMRKIDDFLKMSELCDYLFGNQPEEDTLNEDREIHEQLRRLNLRYFDPTMSAAKGHEDKGLIECLMVKVAKVLILYAGTKDSYGKDVEAAMALSLGKPVIFLCEDESRLNFYKNVHPLSRLIRFDAGVAVGAIICRDKKLVKKLLYRIFYNEMKYYVDRPEKKKGVVERGYYQLKEELTDSVVRIQTNDEFLSKAFWDHYHTL